VFADALVSIWSGGVIVLEDLWKHAGMLPQAPDGEQSRLRISVWRESGLASKSGRRLALHFSFPRVPAPALYLASFRFLRFYFGSVVRVRAWLWQQAEDYVKIASSSQIQGVTLGDPRTV
jgi:hypothetical protein